MNQALVTGASGMLGTHLVEGLRARGCRVRALVRTPAAAPWLALLGAEVCRGDLADRESIRRAAHGCDVVFHAGAAVGAGGSAGWFHAVNVEGTRHVVEAAAIEGARLVHVSSTAVYGDDRYRDRPTDEQVPLPALAAHDVYGQSKQDAERLVIEACAAGRVWAAVVRPPVMYGRRDRQFVPRMGAVMRLGWFPVFGTGNTRLPLVHAAAVADGVIRAAECAEARGQVFLLANDTPVTVTDLITYAARGLGRPVRALRLSERTGHTMFRGLAGVLRIGRRPDLAQHAAGTYRMLTRDNPFTSARALHVLQWTPATDVATAVPEAFAWAVRARREVGLGRDA